MIIFILFTNFILSSVHSYDTFPEIHGILPRESSSVKENEINLPSSNNVTIEIFGQNLVKFPTIGFGLISKSNLSPCDIVTNEFTANYIRETVLHVDINLENPHHEYYICFKRHDDDSWIYPAYIDNDIQIKFTIQRSLIPLWLHIIFVIILFILSGLFSGLNLGLMSLGLTELRILETAGTFTERHYAKRIKPVREKGNLLLCALLLGNVLVNTSLTILMDDLIGSGIVAVIISTFGITVFGEIIPQAICSRYSLAVGAKTIFLTYFVILITFPIAYPISFLLDKIIGRDIQLVYTRDKLSVLIEEQLNAGSVKNDEMKIMTGALSITKKTVDSIMTPIYKTFMVAYNDKLDFHTLTEIFYNGYSRIPVYDKDRQNIVGVLNMKDLAFVDKADKIAVSTICKFYNRPLIKVPHTTHLDVMLKEFRMGRPHIAFVQKQNAMNQGGLNNIIGIVTLEDVIEEIIQAEIEDENDRARESSRNYRKLERRNDFRLFNSCDTQNTRLTPKLKITALRHLVSNFPYFDDSYLNLHLTQNILNSEIVIQHKFSPKDHKNYLIEKDKPLNGLILILQGYANVKFHLNEEYTFEVGPFYSFGQDPLNRVNKVVANYIISSTINIDDFINSINEIKLIPNFEVRAIKDVELLKISYEQYAFARILHDALMNKKSVIEFVSFSDNVEKRLKLDIDAERLNLFEEHWIQYREFVEQRSRAD